MFAVLEGWRRGAESNRRIKVLQTSALPLGYRALLNELAGRPRAFVHPTSADGAKNARNWVRANAQPRHN